MRALLLAVGSTAWVFIAANGCRPDDRPRDTIAVVARPTATAAASAPAQVAELMYAGDTNPPWLDSMLAHNIKFDAPTVDSLGNGAVCYVFPKYIVVSRDLHDEVGSDITVRRAQPSGASNASKPECRPDSLAGDFVIRNHWAEYYNGLDGRWLFLDSGTGNQRGVIIYDVDTRARLPEFNGDVVGWRDSATLLVWRDGDDSVPRRVCPKIPESLTASTDSLMSLSLPSGTMAWAGRWRCSARE